MVELPHKERICQCVKNALGLTRGHSREGLPSHSHSPLCDYKIFQDIACVSASTAALNTDFSLSPFARGLRARSGSILNFYLCVCAPTRPDASQWPSDTDGRVVSEGYLERCRGARLQGLRGPQLPSEHEGSQQAPASLINL